MSAVQESAAEVSWDGPSRLSVGGELFRLIEGRGRQGDGLVLFKPRSMVDRYLGLGDEMVGGRIVELGVYQGGSTAFLAELFRPASLVAVELSDGPPERLGEYLERTELRQRLHCHFGVDQADRDAVAGVVEAAGTPLDLVIDDASHLLGPTMASFDVLFPRVRPGGLYLIEDWSAWLVRFEFLVRALEQPGRLEQIWRENPERVRESLANDPDVQAQFREALSRQPEAAETIMREMAAGGAEAATPAPAAREREVDEQNLVPLVAHLCSAAIAAPEVVASVEVIRGMALVRRGPAELDGGTFDLTTLVDSGLRHPGT